MTEPLRVGLIGAGYAAWKLKLPSYAVIDDIRIVAVADPNEEARLNAQQQAGVPAEGGHADYEELLARGDIDFVDVSTPHRTHRDILIAAANAGVPAICDKPLAMSLADADLVLGATERAGVPSGVYRNFLYFPGWMKFFELAESGAVGQPRQATLIGTSIYAPDLDDPVRSEQRGWRARAAYSGGGIFIDYGIHTVYLARKALGGDQPNRVTATVASLGGAQGDVEDRGTIVLDWRDGRRAVIDMCWGTGTAGASSLQGTTGTLQMQYTSNSSPHDVADGVMLLRGLTGGEFHDVSWTSEPFDWYYRGSLEAFAARVRGDESSDAATLADGRADLEVILAAYQSAALARPVDLPLEASEPVYQRGALGLRELPLPGDSVILERDLYLPAESG